MALPTRGIEFKVFRRWSLYIGGLIGAAYEVLQGKDANPVIVVLVAGALGLDTFLSKDEKDTPPAIEDTK